MTRIRGQVSYFPCYNSIKITYPNPVSNFSKIKIKCVMKTSVIGKGDKISLLRSVESKYVATSPRDTNYVNSIYLALPYL